MGWAETAGGDSVDRNENSLTNLDPTNSILFPIFGGNLRMVAAGVIQGDH